MTWDFTTCICHMWYIIENLVLKYTTYHCQKQIIVVGLSKGLKNGNDLESDDLQTSILLHLVRVENQIDCLDNSMCCLHVFLTNLKKLFLYLSTYMFSTS